MFVFSIESDTKLNNTFIWSMYVDTLHELFQLQKIDSVMSIRYQDDS